MTYDNPGDLNDSSAASIEAINRMEVLRYCERIAWVEPIPTGRSGEYISVMTRRITPAE